MRVRRSIPVAGSVTTVAAAAVGQAAIALTLAVLTLAVLTLAALTLAALTLAALTLAALTMVAPVGPALGAAGQVASTVSVSAQPDPVTAGARVVLVATVGSAVGRPAPTGKVVFERVDPSTAGLMALGTAPLDAGGVARLPVSLPGGGRTGLHAAYEGDATYFGSSGDGSVTVVGGAPPRPPGYWLLGADGGVFSFGAPFFGSETASGLCTPPATAALSPSTASSASSPGPPKTSAACRQIVTTPDSGGYWIVGAGAVLGASIGRHGDAVLPSDNHPAVPVLCPCTPVGMAPTPTGSGFWVAYAGGAVRSAGDAPDLGGLMAAVRRAPVGIASARTGQGYWTVGADGGVFSAGDAPFFGSAGGLKLNAPIIGITATPDGGGYWLLAADGGIFSFGDAAFFGSTGGLRLNAPIVGMAPTRSGRGYWLVATDGGVFSFGDAPFLGSAGSLRLSSPVVGMAAG